MAKCQGQYSSPHQIIEIKLRAGLESSIVAASMKYDLLNYYIDTMVLYMYSVHVHVYVVDDIIHIDTVYTSNIHPQCNKPPFIFSSTDRVRWFGWEGMAGDSTDFGFEWHDIHWLCGIR